MEVKVLRNWTEIGVWSMMKKEQNKKHLLFDWSKELWYENIKQPSPVKEVKRQTFCRNEILILKLSILIMWLQ